MDSWPAKNTTSSPVWVAAISPVSCYNQDKQIERYIDYENQGAELIVTGEIAADWSKKRIEGPIIRFNGKYSATDDLEAIACFGPPEANFLPAIQGVKLVKALKTKCRKSIIANVGDTGASHEDRMHLISALSDVGVDGFEIALSCPNIQHGEVNTTIKWFENSMRFIEEIRSQTNLPVGIKLGTKHFSLGEEYLIQQFRDAGISQITAIDATLTMCPPNIVGNLLKEPFSQFPALSFVGMSGPWCHYLLYGHIARLRTALNKMNIKDISLSAAGGIFSVENAIELLVLGADSIQLCSLVLYRGYQVIGDIISGVKDWISTQEQTTHDSTFKHYSFVSEGLKDIYGENYTETWMAKRPVSRTNLNNCNNCGICTETPCLAREKKQYAPKIIDGLCSGCGWCVHVCPNRAIAMEARN